VSADRAARERPRPPQRPDGTRTRDRTRRSPVVVLSRDAAIPRLRRALVAPCTTTIRSLPSEVVLEPGDDPVPQRSAVNLDSVESVSLAVLVERLGRLADARMREICAALVVAVDCEASV
jgi:mRNA interferase MazF